MEYLHLADFEEKLFISVKVIIQSTYKITKETSLSTREFFISNKWQINLFSSVKIFNWSFKIDWTGISIIFFIKTNNTNRKKERTSKIWWFVVQKYDNIIARRICFYILMLKNTQLHFTSFFQNNNITKQKINYKKTGVSSSSRITDLLVV